MYHPHKDVRSMSSSVQEDSSCLIQALSDIQAEKAEAKSEYDKIHIFSVIEKSPGGFYSMNNQINGWHLIPRW